MGGEESPTSTIISSRPGQSEKKTETRDLKKEMEKARQGGMYFTSRGQGYIENATSATVRNDGFVIKDNAGGGCKRARWVDGETDRHGKGGLRRTQTAAGCF